MSTNPISHQTVRLTPGRHATPAHGACVMELASMLAGERFTDHPRSVCRVIAEFLRAYNDAVDGTRRRDLCRCAAIVVGSRDSRRTERARLACCDRELAKLRGRLPRTWRRLVATAWRTVSPSPYDVAVLDDLAKTLSASEDGHRRAMRLVGDLLEIRVTPLPPCDVMSGQPRATARLGRSGPGTDREPGNAPSPSSRSWS